MWCIHVIFYRYHVAACLSHAHSDLHHALLGVQQGDTIEPRGFRCLILPCSSPVSDLQLREEAALVPRPCLLLPLWGSTAQDLCVVTGGGTRFPLFLQKKRARGGGRAEAHRYLWGAITAGITGPESLIEKSSHNVWKKICPLHSKSMAFNRALQAEKGRAENRSITSSIGTNLRKSLNPDGAQHMIKLRSWRGAPVFSPISPLSVQFRARVQSSAWSPFKEVPIDGWKPLQGDRGGGPSHNLGGNRNRSRFLRGLPALIDEVQVAMHPGHLVGREGVGAIVIWN